MKSAFDADTFKFAMYIGTLFFFATMFDVWFSGKSLFGYAIPLVIAVYAIALGSWVVVGIGALAVRAVRYHVGGKE